MTEAESRRHHQSILLVHGGAAGDFVLSMVLLRALGARDPEPCCLHALCRSRLACYFAQEHFLAGWKFLESASWISLFAPTSEPLSNTLLRYFGGFDSVISMLGPLGGSISKQLRRHYRGELYCIDPKLRRNTAESRTHILEQWQSDLRKQELHFSLADSSFSREILPDQSISSVIIHPGSGSLAKCWGLEQFEKVAQKLCASGRRVRFMVGPVEIERFGDDLKRRLSRIAPVIFEPDICIAARLLASASAYVGNDSGMTHLAAFLGLRTTAVFVSTPPCCWRPLGKDVTVLDGRSKGVTADMVVRSIVRD